MKKKQQRLIVGIDEAGRGSLAGPVAVGAVRYDQNDLVLMKSLKILMPTVKDSKQLSEKRREAINRELAKLIRTTSLRVKVSLVSAKVIDTKGISYAIRKGIEQVLTNLADGKEGIEILLDGGLKAPMAFINQTTYIKGDATHLPIALASIAAKVKRDRHMRTLDRRFPKHGFAVHKGYGTKSHYEALRKYGRTPVHRASFLKNIPPVAGSQKALQQ
ncbi:MAG: ribonuclease HII [Candidatus Pacebacteria bacterium]|nr:ribonuclease HII [Candidatus Paceibacterota bacterium]